MLVVECIAKEKDKNNIIKHYALRDEQGKVTKVSAKELKLAMINNRVI